jgi:hypothetical protein
MEMMLCHHDFYHFFSDEKRSSLFKFLEKKSGKAQIFSTNVQIQLSVKIAAIELKNEEMASST